MNISTPKYFRLRPPRKIRSSQAQLKCLIEYMAANPDLVVDNKVQTTQYMVLKIYKKWEKLAQLLAVHGPEKTIAQWKHTWRDLKRKAREDYIKAGGNGKEKILSHHMSEQNNKVLEAIEIAEKYDPKDEMEWRKNKLWIDTESDTNVIELKHDPLFDVSHSVEYLEQEDELEQEDSQEQVEQDDDDDEDDESEVVQTKSPKIVVRPNPILVKAIEKRSNPPPLMKRPNTSNQPEEPSKYRKITISQEPAHSTVNQKQGNYSDVDVLNTLNKFIDYEKEKDKLAHEREMTRIQQTNRMLAVMEKISDVFESMAPSIKKTLEKDGNGYR